MATRNGKYCVIDLNDNWTRTSVEDSKVAIATNTEVIWGEIAAHLPEFNDKVASFAAPALALPLTKALVTSPSKAPEPYHWSPTQQQVDAYVNSLESEVSQEGLRMRQRRTEERGQPAPVAVPRWIFSGLILCFVAATVACAWWLSQLFD